MSSSSSSPKDAVSSKRVKGKPRRETKVERSTEVESPKLSVKTNLIQDCLQGLQNTRVVSAGSDTKDPAPTLLTRGGADYFTPPPIVTYDTKVIGMMRGLFARDRPYTARLSRAGSIATGSSILSVNIATDLTRYSEGSALTALFDECLLHRTVFSAVLSISPGTNQFAYYIGYTPIVTATAPTPTSVARLPVSTLATTLFPTPASSRLSAKVRAPLWGQTNQEGQSTAPAIRSGLDGTWQICDSGTTPPPSTTTLFAYALVSEAAFRIRG